MAENEQLSDSKQSYIQFDSPASGADSKERHPSWFFWRAGLGLAIVVGVGLGLIFSLGQTDSSGLIQSELAAIEIGSSEAAVIDQLGEGRPATPATDAGPDLSCRSYVAEDSDSSAKLCFRAGQLAVIDW